MLAPLTLPLCSCCHPAATLHLSVPPRVSHPVLGTDAACTYTQPRAVQDARTVWGPSRHCVSHTGPAASSPLWQGSDGLGRARWLEIQLTTEMLCSGKRAHLAGAAGKSDCGEFGLRTPPRAARGPISI